MAEPLDPGLRRVCLAAAGACALPLLLRVPPWLALLFVVAGVIGALLARKPPALLRLALTLAFGGLVLGAYNFGIGRDTGSAGLLAMLALKPMETFGTRDARSLLGFALFAPFAAFLQDQGVVTMVLAVPAMLGVIMAWAALLQPGSPTGGLRLLRQAGFAVAVALPLALAGFWLFPRLGAPLWGLPENASKSMGLGDRMTPSDWLDVLVDDTPALRATFPRGTPPRSQLYWRGPVLSNFDGEAWTRNRSLEYLAVPRVEPGGVPIAYELTMEPTERHDLVQLDIPLGAPPGARLNADLVAISDDPINNIVSFAGRAAPRVHYVGPLGFRSREANLALPPRNSRTAERARAWAAETPDPLRLTERFMQWIKADFQYTLSAPPVGINSVDDFLFDTRAGFCQHFSSAYVVFMRSAGIPARVVTGYAGGYYNEVGGYWVVYRKDAHAWAEVWVEGQGWVRVDPTAAVAPENVLDTVDDLQLQQQPSFAGELITQMFDAGDFLRKSWNDLVLGFNSARQRNLLAPLGLQDADPGELVLAFAVGATLALGFTLWLLLRQHRDESDPLVLAWRRFARRIGGATGLERAVHEPPLAYATRIGQAVPDAAEGLLALSRRYVDWRYGGRALPPPDRAELARHLREYRLPPRRTVRQGVTP
jgi:transglutaminase-like putative cysteine protease